MQLRVLALFSVVSVIPRISNVSAPVPALHGVVTLTLGGSDETRDAYIFTSIGGAAFAPDGRIVIHEGKTSQMRVFGADGKLIYSFGQRGQGPGDFSDACCMTFDATGHMWVTEYDNRRYSVLELGPTRSRFLWSVPMPKAQIAYTHGRLTWDDRHHIVHMIRVPARSNSDAYSREFLDSTGRVLRVDTIPPPPADSLAPMYTAVSGTGSSGYPQPFGAYRIMAQGPGGSTATAVSSTYAVRWVDGTGKLVAQINKSIVGPAVTAGERAGADSMLDGIAARFHVSRGTIGLKVPTTKPVLDDVFFDIDGRLWVQRAVVRGAQNVADVYGTGGVLVETVTWPPGVSLHEGTIHGNVALGEMRDEMGSHEVVRVEFRAK